MIKTDSLKKKSGNESTALFSNGEEIIFSTEELCAFHIREGREYSETEYEELINKVMIQRAKLKVMPYVIYTKRTEKQVCEKIVAEGFASEVAALLVEELKEKEYISDKDYVLSYLKKTGDKGDSRQKIFFDLKNKGVAASLVEEVLAEMDFDDYKQAEIALNKKLRTGGKKDYNKLSGFLLRKGFSGAIVRKVLQEFQIGRNEEY